MNKLHVKFFQMLLFGLALLMLPSQNAEAQTVASRNASNTLSCTDNTLEYAMYINLAGPTDAFYKFQWSGFTEYADGTAELNGAFVNVNDSSLKFNVSATFSGRTFSAPVGSPKEHACAPESSADWYYYTSVTGNLMGVNGLWGANISLSTPTPSNDVPAFQIGTGANITDQPGVFGMSGWLDMVVTSQANNAANAITLESTPVGTEGDFNFGLTGASLTPPTTPSCNTFSGGQIGGAQMNCGGFNPSPLTNNVSPDTGSDPVEYLWLASTTGCPTSPTGQGIANSNAPTYDPAFVAQTTYFIRCSRRVGCTAWVGESNCVAIIIDENCGNTCDNVTSGGSISGTQTNCGPFNPTTLTSSAAPSGGSGDIEYLWLSSTSGCPTSAINQGIPNTNNPTYNPGTITQTTYFLRCSRSVGCTAWVGESNCITLTVDNNCGGGGDEIDLELTFTSPQASVNAYQSFEGTITITNNSSTTATGVVVDIDKNGNVVQSGTVSQGSYSSWPTNVWTVGTLAPGESATFDGAFYSLENNPQIYAQVSAANETDVDSTPGNGTCCSAGEDDEAVIEYGGGSGGNTCQVTITANTMNVQCDDNGTPTNPNDDTYTFQVMANATAQGGVALWGWFVEGNASVMYDYGQAVSFGPFPISGGNQTLTIIDQDNLTCELDVTAVAPAPCSTNPTTPSISVSDVTVNESAGDADVNICLSSVSTQNVTFIASTGGGTATAGTDYSNQSYAIFIPAGSTCATFSVPIIDDSADEPNETVNVTLSGVGNATVADGTGVITIIDNDVSSGNLIDLELTFTSPQTSVNAFTSFDGTITVTNNSSTTATGVVVDIDKNGNVVQSGTVSQGNFSTWPSEVWTVGTLAPGQSATLEGAFYSLQNNPQIYAQVSAANQTDVDSTPGNGACCSAGEDDEAVIEYGNGGGGNTCQVTITANTMNVQCNDNGTPNNPNDDTYTFQVMANATAQGGVALWGWFVEGNASVMYDYGQAVSFGPFPISGGNQTITIIDQDNLTCELDVTAVAPAPCSTPANNLPTAVNDAATTDSNTPVMIMVTMNDSFGGDGPNNGQIVVTSNPSNGSASVNTNGTPNDPTDDKITYTPNSGFTGTDTFVYRITDSNGDTDTAVVSVTVTPSNNTPTAVDDTATTDSNTSIMIMVTMNDDFGADGPNNWQVVLTTNPTFGVAYVNTNGTTNDPTDDKIVYIPNAGFVGTDQLVYRIADADGDLSYATVTINVTAANGMPTAMDDTATTNSGQMVMTMVTMNDSFGSDGPNNGQIVIIGNPSNGTASVNNNGTPSDPTDDKIVYTSENGFVGTDQVTYRITDSNGDQDFATLTITVNMPNGNPDAVNDQANTTAGQSVMVMVLNNDDFGTDGPNNGSIIITNNGNNGTATVNNNGTPNDPTDDKITYTPNAGFSGTDQVTYQITDSNGDTDTATITITVTQPNGNPNAITDNATVDENGSVTIDVTGNDDFGTDGAANGMISIISSPSNGTATVNGNGTATTADDTVTYTPNPGFTGQDSFVYQITDGNGDTSTATVNITVNAVGPSVCNTSTVTNASSGGCNTNNFNRGFYSDDLVGGLSGNNSDSYNVSNGVFTEFDDGTATFTGTFTMHGNSNARFNAVVNFSGRTFNGSAKTSSCVNSTADWYYYTNVNGTLTGTHHLAGGVLDITTLTGAPDDEFQVGTGANLFDANLFGASAWFSYNIVSQPNGSAHFNNGAQTDFNFVLSGSPTACGSNPNGGGNGTCADGKDVLFVVGNTNLNNGDDAARDILEDLGFDVMLIDDDVVTTASGNSKDLIVISSTVSSGKVGHTFETTSTPVVVWEAWLFDEMNIASGGSYGTQIGDDIHIFDENHPITDGFTGDVQVYTTHKNLTFGTPQFTGNDQAFIPGQPTDCVIISFDTGDEMSNNFHAPGRRVGLFLHNDGAAYLTADGRTLVENAFLYAVNCPTSGSSNFTAPQADLITVTAKRDLNNVDVKWANNTGYKNAYFLVQHSLDGVSFETIAEVDNDSDDENLAFYVWTDENPAIGENYYRIQVMYRDAQGWNFSDNSKVMFSEIFDFQLFPNPAMDYVDLNLEEIVGNEVTITIVNQLGQTVQVEQINEVTSLHRLQLQNIKYDGQYIVWITTDGRKPIAKSLVVMKN